MANGLLKWLQTVMIKQSGALEDMTRFLGSNWSLSNFYPTIVWIMLESFIHTSWCELIDFSDEIVEWDGGRGNCGDDGGDGGEDCGDDGGDDLLHHHLQTAPHNKDCLVIVIKDVPHFQICSF